MINGDVSHVMEKHVLDTIIECLSTATLCFGRDDNINSIKNAKYILVDSYYEYIILVETLSSNVEWGVVTDETLTPQWVVKTGDSNDHYGLLICNHDTVVSDDGRAMAFDVSSVKDEFDQIIDIIEMMEL